jgi:hypothetical protein
LRYPVNTFISVLLFNNLFLKKILKEENPIIEEAIKAKDYLFAFIYQLMFLKYSNLEALKLNEIIIGEDLHYYKFYVEDKFGLHYAARRKLTDLLLSSKYINHSFAEMATDEVKGLAKNFIIEMGVMKSFKAFNYLSFLGCIRMFFQNSTIQNALLFSIFFAVFNVTPSIILRNLYKFFIRVRHKEWQKVWFGIVMAYAEMSKGNRRLMS